MGRQRSGEQVLSLQRAINPGDGTYIVTGIVAHEFMHALSF